MKLLRLLAMSAIFSVMASVALAQSPAPLEGTVGFGESYSDIDQIGPGNGATTSQEASDGARNDSFVIQDTNGGGGIRSATTFQQGGAGVKNYSFIEQVGGSLNTANVTQGFGSDTSKDNRSEIFQDGLGNNTVSVNQTGSGSFNESFVRRQTGTGGNNISIQQNGASNSNSSDILLQGGDTNTTTVTQGLIGSGTSNTSLITEQDGPGGNNHITIIQDGFAGTVNASTVRQFGTGAGDNAVEVTQTGGVGTTNTSFVDQEGELNDAMVTQGDFATPGITNSSTVAQLGSNTATVNQK